MMKDTPTTKPLVNVDFDKMEVSITFHGVEVKRYVGKGKKDIAAWLGGLNIKVKKRLGSWRRKSTFPDGMHLEINNYGSWCIISGERPNRVSTDCPEGGIHFYDYETRENYRKGE